MAERTGGMRSILSLPTFYDSLQRALGASAMRDEVVSRYVRPTPGMRILDIGCGTSEILGHLPDSVVYFGVDPSAAYVDSARARYGDRGEFTVGGVRDFGASDLPERFEVVIALGVLHHLDDEDARYLFDLAWNSLVDGGRLVTIDPTLTSPQAQVSKWLVKRDRGQNVRTPEEYAALANTAFDNASIDVRYDLLRVPYTHCVMVCTR